MADLMDDTAAMTDDQVNGALEAIRAKLTDVIRMSESLERSLIPPVVQEAVLARRDAENARMRYGVAQAKFKGFDPWLNKVTEKSQAGTK